MGVLILDDDVLFKNYALSSITLVGFLSGLKGTLLRSNLLLLVIIFKNQFAILNRPLNLFLCRLGSNLLINVKSLNSRALIILRLQLSKVRMVLRSDLYLGLFLSLLINNTVYNHFFGRHLGLLLTRAQLIDHGISQILLTHHLF